MVVGISGYYGFRNAGDEAILEAMVQEISWRGHEALVFSANPAETSERYGARAVSRSNPLVIWKTLREIDLLLSGGGGLLQDKTSRASLWYYLTVMGLAKRRGKPVCVFNQSLGPLSHSGEERVKKVLQNARCIVRDRASLLYAERLGIKAALGADPALLLQVPPVEREASMVVLVPRGGTEEANQTLKQAGERLRTDGYEVVVLGMQPSHDEQALEAFSGFTKELAWDPKRVMYLLAQAGYVLSVRLHGLILAAAARTPYAGIAYDPKVAGFCQDSGAPWLDTPGQPAFFVQAVETRSQPSWNAVENMKDLASKSFDQVLASPASSAQKALG